MVMLVFGARDFSGFDRENWVPRSNTEHRSNSESLLLCTSKSQLRKKGSELGCRYSCLQKLPYYDAPRMLVVDPMHNLFLGLAKHFTKRVLIEKQLLTESDFEVIQQRTDKIVTPADIGRIPYKIQSFFSSFTADQFKNWVVHYSLIAMHGLLQNDDLECWRHLVLAFRAHSCVKTCFLNLLETRIEFLSGRGILFRALHVNNFAHAHNTTHGQDVREIE